MAMILDAFVSRFGELLVKLVEDEVAMLLGVSDEINKLQRTLRKIECVLADAERRRVDDSAINNWLMELKNVMYDADDILDECMIEAEKCSKIPLDKGPSSSSTVSVRCNFPPFSCFRKALFTHEIGNRIKSLNSRLGEISAERDQFDLKLSSRNNREGGIISNKTSSVVEPDIVGTRIDEDTQSLVELLTKEDTRENLLVFAIMGTGGIGKTTLAQKIFDDQKIKDNFSIKMWVCVSQEFKEDNLLRDIISCTGGKHNGTEGRNLLEPMVESIVKGKKVLLVLDDVWAEEVWDDLLRKPLRGCGFGSRILVTTRNEGVAKQMKAVHLHQVKLLSPEDGWSLLCKKVVLSGEEREIHDLKGIGMEIVGKCDGLPLALKVVGGVLSKKNPPTRRAWKEVLESTTWSVTGLPVGIHKALYLSYEDLPSHLKQCFLYCSLFPEDLEISTARLVRLWIAEGFVKLEGSSSMEDVGEEYYRELVSRNLLQPLIYYQLGCKMHDLLRSLAQFLTREESLFCREVQEYSNTTIKVRRLSIVGKEMMTIPDGSKSLRALLVFQVHRSDLVDSFRNLHCLRVLDISWSVITELPDSLGSLIHLRYISLESTEIRAIPESIGNLRNLQFLLLTSCRFLNCLPKSVGNLHKLRCLHLDESGVDGIPLEVGRLYHLNSLSGFTLHSNNFKGCCTLEELRPLTQLRRLTIENLERASIGLRARGSVLENKPHLTKIWLRWTPSGVDEVRCIEEKVKGLEEVFEELRPPPCVETLSIFGYYGRKFPSWMMAGTSLSTSVLSNITRLVLVDCTYCEQLPPLGQLPNLEFLFITGASTIVSIGLEFLGTSGGGTRAVHASPSFPKLTVLTVKEMPNWEEWQWEDGAPAMPCLKSMLLENCPKLISLPHGLLRHATALTNLKITGASSLRAVENLRSLKHLELKDSPNIERISDLPELTEVLWIDDCPGLQTVYNLSNAMRHVVLTDTVMETLPQWLSVGIQIVESGMFDIDLCSFELFGKICRLLEEQEWPKIQHIHHVDIRCVNEEIDVRASYTKTPFSFSVYKESDDLPRSTIFSVDSPRTSTSTYMQALEDALAGRQHTSDS